jgi:hypothetical protein
MTLMTLDDERKLFEDAQQKKPGPFTKIANTFRLNGTFTSQKHPIYNDEFTTDLVGFGGGDMPPHAKAALKL